MARSENLPVLPQAVSQVMRLADDPNSSQKDLEKAFERDPAITAKILKVANSAYYGGTQVPTIGRAISFLGMTTIRSLVVGVAFQQVLGNRTEVRGFDKLGYWRHSLATAVSSRILGKLTMPAKSEELYCAGMMHDIGLLILERFLPKELEEAIDLSTKSGRPLLECEKKFMDFDHLEVGSLLTEKWGLSDLIIQAIRHHDAPTNDRAFNETTKLVHFANKIANFAGYPCFGANPPMTEEQLAKQTGLPQAQIPVILQVVRAELDKAQESFNIAA